MCRSLFFVLAVASSNGFNPLVCEACVVYGVNLTQSNLFRRDRGPALVPLNYRRHLICSLWSPQFFSTLHIPSYFPSFQHNSFYTFLGLSDFPSTFPSIIDVTWWPSCRLPTDTLLRVTFVMSRRFSTPFANTEFRMLQFFLHRVFTIIYGSIPYDASRLFWIGVFRLNTQLTVVTQRETRRSPFTYLKYLTPTKFWGHRLLPTRNNGIDGQTRTMRGPRIDPIESR